jgi:hypothetical protein
MEGCSRQLLFLKALLNYFASSIGLKINFEKSMTVPINMSSGRIHHLAATFGCSVGNLPFTYLGLPLGLTKPRVEEFMPLITRCERRLVSTSLFFLSQAGRLQITNSVFTALPTFYMSTLSPSFSSKKAYHQLKGSSGANPFFEWMWRSSCQHTPIFRMDVEIFMPTQAQSIFLAPCSGQAEYP